jgi:uncharacterized membrane protein
MDNRFKIKEQFYPPSFVSLLNILHFITSSSPNLNIIQSNTKSQDLLLSFLIFFKLTQERGQARNLGYIFWLGLALK